MKTKTTVDKPEKIYSSKRANKMRKKGGKAARRANRNKRTIDAGFTDGSVGRRTHLNGSY